MNTKQLLLIGGVVLVVLIVSVLLLQGGKKPQAEVIEPTPTPAYQEVDSSVEATLTLNAANTAVKMQITGLAGKYTGIEYELNYQTDEGPKGTLSGTKPITLASGEDVFERPIELGTCSTGGKCRYDKGVRDFRLFVKLTTSEGTVYILKKTIESL